MEQTKSKKIRRIVYNFAVMLAGCLLSAIAINAFYLPLQLTTGGFVGIASIIYQVTKGNMLSVGTIVLIVNIPVFLIAWKVLGFRIIPRSLICTILYSVITDLTAVPLTEFYHSFLSVTLSNGNTPDPLIFCICSGVVLGAGTGLIYRAGYTSGGSTIVGSVVHKLNRSYSVARVLLIIDVIVLVVAAFAYRSINQSSMLLALYSGISVYISSLVTDYVIVGYDRAKIAYIISQKNVEITDAILYKLRRGVTAVKSRGAYSNSQSEMLMVALGRAQVRELQKIVSQIDPEGMMMVVDSIAVSGKGFDPID